MYSRDGGDLALAGSDLSLAHGPATVVHQASIHLHHGRVTALVGPNGSGKSTLLRALARLHRPVSGCVSVGRDGDSAPCDSLSSREFATHVTMLTQHRPNPGGVTVGDVVGYGRYPHRSRWRGTDPGGADAIARAMSATGVTSMASRSVEALSGGELQRVWLASCLAQETPVLLLDEPTNHLDLRYQVDILDVIRDLVDERDVAVGVVLHDLDQAAAVADEVVLMSEGHVHAAGASEDVLTAADLSHVFGVTVHVGVDPESGQLRTRPIGRHNATAARRTVNA